MEEELKDLIVKRIMLKMIKEEIYKIYEGVGRVEEIDKEMKIGEKNKMGKMKLEELIGIDKWI